MKKAAPKRKVRPIAVNKKLFADVKVDEGITPVQPSQTELDQLDYEKKKQEWAARPRHCGYRLPCGCLLEIEIPVKALEQFETCAHGALVRIYKEKSPTESIAPTVSIKADVVHENMVFAAQEIIQYPEV
ncbi:MAG: hypothetical protein KGN01_06250 [Patescibacteria group bacterium]|nr:hypothetical protein [Patescibacteria group bacterium]